MAEDTNQRLRMADKRMQRQYLRRNTTPYDVCHLFQPEDQVLLKEQQ